MDTIDFEITEQVMFFMVTSTTDQLGQLTVGRLAKQFNMSRAYLHKIFRNCKRVSPGDILRMIKLFRAAQMLLRDPDIRVKEISRSLGFARTDHFICLFKKTYGITPLRYRKTCGRTQ